MGNTSTMKFLSRATFMLIAFFGFMSISNAQLNTLTIDNPASIAGDYDGIIAGFGDVSGTTVAGAAIFVDDAVGTVTDGCEATAQDFTGAIAFIDRGTCAFVDKANNAQNAGAIAFVVCQNTGDPAFTMAGTDPGITIPGLMISMADCDVIRTEIMNGGVTASVSFKLPPCEPDPPANALWGTTEGEGDFSGGLNEWTTSNEPGLGWTWDALGTVNQGAYDYGDNIASPTVCNGAVVFHSDFLDNNGIAGNFGFGDCPSPCEGTLTSPEIDLSGVTVDGLAVVFSQALAHFTNSEYYVEVTTDGGSNWTSFPINSEFPINGGGDFNTRNDQRVALCGVDTDATAIQIRFRYVGNYYYWAVDDVFLVNEAYTDLQVDQGFYSVATNFKTPASQGQIIPFLADIRNRGNVASLNTVLNASVSNSDGDVLFSSDNGYGDLGSCNADPIEVTQNDVHDMTYTPNDPVGEYFITHSISSDTPGEFDESNNTRTANYMVTESTFGKLASEADQGTNYLSGFSDGFNWSGGYYSAGTNYFVPNGNGYAVDKVRFGIDADAATVTVGSISLSLYEWAGDADLMDDVNPEERTEIATAQITIIPNNPLIPDLRNIEVSFDGGPVPLKDNTNYILMAHMNPVSIADPENPDYDFLSFNANSSTSEVGRSWYYGATGLAFDSLGMKRYSSLRAIGADGTDVDSRIFVSWPKTPYFEMDIMMIDGTEDINESIGLSVFPNPATDNKLMVDLDLQEVSRNVSIEIADVQGKVVSTFNFSDIKSELLPLDITGISSGVYVLNVRSEEGFKSTKFVVQK